MLRKEGTRGEVRSSALWGTGSRGGESRSNALWGKGGRNLVMGLAACAVLVFPFAAGANKGAADSKHGARPTPSSSYVTSDLEQQANNSPNQKIRVIVQSSAGMAGALHALNGLAAQGGSTPTIKRKLDVVDAIAAELPAGRIKQLERLPGLTITPDSEVRLTSDPLPSDLTTGTYTSTQMWAHETGNSFSWGSKSKPALTGATIAVVDSGIDANRADFDLGKRVLAQVNLSTLSGNSTGDGRGHGTFVAGMAAGSAPGYAGASPTSKLVSIDVMDDNGMARTSDVIAGAQWILANKDAYGIRVANFSLHATTPSNFIHDPLDKAVEKLWFAGVTVVVAAGNYGIPTGPSGVMYAPGNDPFVITVGAVDMGHGVAAADDSTAPWSAYGYTYDGFMKPEIAAPGRYLVGPIPAGSTLAAQKAANIVAPGYIQLSGTSFAAPIVSGTAAQMLAAHPSWTPDQIKGVLMVTARSVPQAPKGSVGVGEITASKAIAYTGTPPNPNKALDGFVLPDTTGGGSTFNSVSWFDQATNSVSWDSVSWNDTAWGTVSWNDVSWQDVSWNDVSWQDVSWNDVASSGTLADVSWEDAAEGDADSTDGVLATQADIDQSFCDPTLNPDPLPAACATITSSTP
jgi:serine protease AprX